MQVLACSDLIDPASLECPSGWIIQTVESPLITLDMIPELTGGALLIFVIAYGGRIIRKQFNVD